MSSSLHRNWTVVIIIMIVLFGGGGVFGLNLKDSGAAGFIIFASIVASIQTLVCVMCAGILGFLVVLSAFAPFVILVLVISNR